MPVAIRTATRIQDQDDINVSLGAGVNGYALVWDDASGKFVLTATGDVVGPASTSKGQWFTKTPMPKAAADEPAVSYGGKIYCFGGYQAGVTVVHDD